MSTNKFLTKRKQKFVAQRKPAVIKGKPLYPNLSAASRYKERLDKLIDKMTADVEKQLKKLFDTDHAEAYFALDASISSQARILTNALANKFNDIFASLSKPLAEQMTGEAEKASSSALHGSLTQLSGGLTLKTSLLTDDIKDIMNATVTENVGLIKSISEEYLSGVQGAVMRSITTGNGLQDLLPYLEKHKGITKRRARVIAYDQTRKAFASINYGRMDKLGLKEFEWLHTGGSKHPRKLHQQLSGKIFSIDNPPIIDNNTGQRGLPSQLINCHCVALPVIKFEE